MEALTLETVNAKPSFKPTGWLVFTVISVTLGSCVLVGYDIGILNTPQTTIGLWIRRAKCVEKGGIPGEVEGQPAGDLWCEKLDGPRRADMFSNNKELNTLWALLNCLIPGGSVFGALASSFFINCFGPKKSLLLNNCLAISAVLLNSLARTAGSVEMLIVGRLFSGLNSGVIVCVAPTYLNEISPDHLRGAVGATFELSIGIAILLSTVVGLPNVLGNLDLWHYMLALAAVPTFFQLITLPFCPDSPKYVFFSRQDDKETLDALGKLHGRTNAKRELAAIQEEYSRVKDEPLLTLKDILIDPFLRRILFITMGLHLCQQFSGIDATMFYSTAMFQEAGLSGKMARYATIGMVAIYVVGTAISMVLVEKVGRKILLLIGYSGAVVFLSILTASMLLFDSGEPPANTPHAKNPYAPAAYASCVSLVCFVVIFSAGPAPIPWVLMSEYFAQRPRAVAAGPAAATNRFGSLVVALVFPYMQASLNGYLFLIFIGLNIGFIVFTCVYVIETKGKTSDEIQAELRARMEGNRAVPASHGPSTLT
ncbi:Solute carrier family 2, facilitated glucose transporter member 2 [Hypsibius exemplaris]|uniref:Solute carrier family 2, facilitated glucose transporter member 2 n=1 Tax=Hypsibius exemplaris TaxID=2072580 RepID=A0A1W0WQ86_HYPEX|nr:Solute carrier family 2, facilitated glucose transporter member 2 [Hypsibius exemplaris]